mgnify:CR=1 FL=1
MESGTGEGAGFASGVFFFFQAEDGIRCLVRSRGLGDVYKRQFHYDALGPRATGRTDREQVGAAWQLLVSGELHVELSLIHI